MPAFLAGALGALTLLVLLALGVAFAGARHRRRRFARGRAGGLRFVFRRLGTRPDQERVLSAEADALAEELAGLRADARALRAELADLLSAPTLDGEAIRAILDRPLARLGAVRARAEAAIARAHATLDPAQREALAALVRCGPRRRLHAP